MHYPVIIVGGGITGIGILRDLSMRGIRALLIEQKDLAYGASSRFHGLLHSGARYVVGDPGAGAECIAENKILRQIAPHAVELTEGFFVRLAQDPEEYEERWVKACADVGLDAKPIGAKEALRLEPNMAPDIRSAYIVPDSAVDGFRIVWQNAASAKQYGGELRNYTELAAVHTANGAVKGITVRSTISGATEEIGCDFIINAAGSWAGQVAHLAGVDVHVTPSRGLLLGFNHRFTDRIVNRLRKPGDGDIFVPHGSITIFGTTSKNVERPDDHAVPPEECLELLKMGKLMFPDIESYRILRGFAGTRPLYSPSGSAGRDATRNFVVLDHEKDGLQGMASIVGGKFTTYRLMAERMSDLVAARFSNTTPCRTAKEPLTPDASLLYRYRAMQVSPSMGVDLAISRQGERFKELVETLEQSPDKRALLCECELVTRAECEMIAAEPTTHFISDIRRRTRMGMGTCQASFCAFRSVGALFQAGMLKDNKPASLLKQFIEERWSGIRPMLWGSQIKEIELNRGIYGAL
ncbi:MAG: anaerobic glycerol-3-phosphate dehydrogenase subunit A, partial [Deferribacteraceae bacterium]|nr:anaerobic glycerol-3-phosphate dehydrogenase subunit A [Deferribacteraceae bacterium]